MRELVEEDSSLNFLAVVPIRTREKAGALMSKRKLNLSEVYAMRTPCCRATTIVENEVEMCVDCGRVAGTDPVPLVDVPKPFLLSDQLAMYSANGDHIGHLVDIVNQVQWNKHVNAAITARDMSQQQDRRSLLVRR